MDYSAEQFGGWGNPDKCTCSVTGLGAVLGFHTPQESSLGIMKGPSLQNSGIQLNIVNLA